MKGLLQQAERSIPVLADWPGGRQFARSTNHRSSACQVILSVSTAPVLSLRRKDPGDGFPDGPPSGPVWVDRSGIASGQTVKRGPAFGPDRVVYTYPAVHYPKWRAEFPLLAREFHAGAFGEGFTLTGLDEQTACIGDLIRVGSCRLQLSEPGQPDEWLYANPRRNIVEIAKRNNRVGWYYRVAEPGWVTGGDSAVLLKRPNPSWSVTRFSQILGEEDPTRKDLAELSALEGLSSEWQLAARKALRGVEQSLAVFWGR